MAKINNSDQIRVLVRIRRNWITHTSFGNVKWYSHLENSLAVSLKTKKKMDLEIAHLGIFPREIKSYFFRMCISSLFILTNNWKLPKCFLIGQWLNTCGISIPLNIYSTIYRCELVIYTAPWTSLEEIMLSGKSQPQKVKYCMISLIFVECHNYRIEHS